MKKDPSGNWIMEKNDLIVSRRLWHQAWGNMGDSPNTNIWFEVMLGLIKHNGLEITPQPPETRQPKG